MKEDLHEVSVNGWCWAVEKLWWTPELIGIFCFHSDLVQHVRNCCSSTWQSRMERKCDNSSSGVSSCTSPARPRGGLREQPSWLSGGFWSTERGERSAKLKGSGGTSSWTKIGRRRNGKTSWRLRECISASCLSCLLHFARLFWNQTWIFLPGQVKREDFW